jgi:Ca-activated chloride channel homolog
MIKLIPIRNALSNKKHRLDIVLQITVPPSDTTLTPQKNLSLVIDRSGSMSGDKIRYACEALEWL